MLNSIASVAVPQGLFLSECQAEGSPIDRWNASQPQGLQASSDGAFEAGRMVLAVHPASCEVRYGDRLERINGIRVRGSPAEAQTV